MSTTPNTEDPMTTVAAAAAELDITEDTVATIAGQLADAPDLYNAETGEITDAGMELVRACIAENSTRTGFLDDVIEAAEQCQQAAGTDDADTARAIRDAKIRAAVAYGHTKIAVAAAAGISRTQLEHIIR